MCLCVFRACVCARVRLHVQGPVLLLAQHSSHHRGSGLVSVSSEPVGAEGKGEQERKRGKERGGGGEAGSKGWARGRVGVGGGGGGGVLSPWTDGLLFLNTCGTMFRLSLPSSWSRTRRSVGPRRSLLVPHTSAHEHAHVRSAHKHPRSFSPSAHMLKSSPLLSASKTQHPRLLCCCQVLPLADATGESYPSEVAVPRERRGTAVTFSRHSCEPKHVSIIWEGGYRGGRKKNIIYGASLSCTLS